MQIFELTNFGLHSGETLPRAQLAYQTYGQLNAAKSNAILYPTSYGAQHTDIEWLIGADGILNSSRYFVVIPNMFGNGLSTSPSNLGDAWDERPWPAFTHVDNITAQRRLLAEVFGIERLALIYGWSMGGQQALHWGALYPEQVERIAALCTAAKTSIHNRVFLEGIQATLTADPAWNGIRFTSKPERGLRALGRAYAAWALSQSFYREQLYREIGYSTLEDFLVRDWEAGFLRRDADNLLSMIETWKRSDISDNEHFGGDLRRALASIQAQTLIMPSATDLYFTAEDAQAESRHIPHAQFRPIPSIWGHRAGNPQKNPADAAFIKEAVAELLDS